jgi:hypothetical protein
MEEHTMDEPAKPTSFPLEKILKTSFKDYVSNQRKGHHSYDLVGVHASSEDLGLNRDTNFDVNSRALRAFRAKVPVNAEVVVEFYTQPVAISKKVVQNCQLYAYGTALIPRPKQ